MKRSEKSRQRAIYRWEFARRNKEYQSFYDNLTKNKREVIDLEIVLKEGCESDFIKKFFVLPINPTFSYDQIVEEYKKIAKLEKTISLRRNSIYRKHLGENWQRINIEFFKHESPILKHGSKLNLKKYRVAMKRAKAEIETFESEQDSNKNNIIKSYLARVLHHLSSTKLSFAAADLYLPHSIVINSYLTDSPNVQVYGYEYGPKFLTLVDSNVTDFDTSPLIDKFDGDLTRVCFEVDLSYPKDDIISDLKQEISKWKSVARKYAQHKKEGRQNLYPADVYKILRVFDLKEKGLTYREIAGTESSDAIQKTMNMYKKAKRYIDGGYKQIR